MSDTPAPTDPNALLFPAFVYGDHATCRRKMKAEIKRWIKRYEECGDFPEPKLIPVPPGSLMIASSGAGSMLTYGASKDNPRWYFYLIDELRMELRWPSRPPREIFQPQFETFARRYPWGALSVAINTGGITSIDIVTQRLEGVLSFWEKLDTLRYLDLHFRELSLANLMVVFYEGTIRMWVDDPRGSVQDVLPAVVERMRNASEDEIQMRMMRRLHEVADTDPVLKQREWLKSSGVIEEDLARMKEMNPDWYEDMKTGRWYSEYLVKLEKKYPGA